MKKKKIVKCNSFFFVLFLFVNCLHYQMLHYLFSLPFFFFFFIIIFTKKKFNTKHNSKVYFILQFDDLKLIK